MAKTKKEYSRYSEYKTMACVKCGSLVNKVADKAIGVICSNCTQQMAGPPKNFKDESRVKLPRNVKSIPQFVDETGKVYQYGIEVPELMGKFEPTIIEKNTITKREKANKYDEALKKYNDAKKLLDTNLSKTDQKHVASTLKTLEKEVNKYKPRTVKKAKRSKKK